MTNSTPVCQVTICILKESVAYAYQLKTERTFSFIFKFLWQITHIFHRCKHKKNQYNNPTFPCKKYDKGLKNTTVLIGWYIRNQVYLVNYTDTHDKSALYCLPEDHDFDDDLKKKNPSTFLVSVICYGSQLGKDYRLPHCRRRTHSLYVFNTCNLDFSPLCANFLRPYSLIPKWAIYPSNEIHGMLRFWSPQKGFLCCANKKLKSAAHHTPFTKSSAIQNYTTNWLALLTQKPFK